MLKTFVKAHPELKRVALLVMRFLAPVLGGLKPHALLRYPRFFSEYREFKAQGGRAALGELYPCLFDKTEASRVDPQYFYQGVWAFRAILANRPPRHVDIASEVNFVGLLTCITQVTFVDIRPLELAIPNYKGLRGSLLELPFADDSVESLSCLHVIEHVGLGRYGDPIDPCGPEKSCMEVGRVLMPSGLAYISVPVGRPRVAFNGLRVFAVEDVLTLFSGLELVEMSLVDARGEFHGNVDPAKADIREAGAGSDFGLGLFMLRKGKP